MGKFVRIFERFSEFCGLLSGLILFLLSIAITLDVTIRWITGKPIVGVFEFSQVAFLASVFLVIALVQNRDRHIRVDILISELEGKPRYILEAFVSFWALLLFAVLLYVGWKEWFAAWKGHYVSRGLIDIPNTLHLGFLLFGAFLMCVSVVLTILRNVALLFSLRKPSMVGNRQE